MFGPTREASERCSACVHSEDETDQERRFVGADELRAHIAMVHVSWMPFECILCPMTCMPNEMVLKQHYQQSHPKKVPKAIYTYEERKKIEAERLFCESQKLNGQKQNHDDERIKMMTKPPLDKTTIIPVIPLPANYQDLPIKPELSHQPTRKNNLLQSNQKFAHKAELSNDDNQYSEFESNCDETSTLGARPQDRPTIVPAIEVVNAEDGDDDAVFTVDTNNTESVTFHSDEDDQEQASVLPSDVNSSEIAIIASSDEAPKQCNVCFKTVISHAGRHVWRHHIRKLRFCCNVCDHGTKLVTQMKRHVITHHRDLGEFSWTDRAPQLLAEYLEAFKKSFDTIYKRHDPFQTKASVDQETGANERRCRICNQVLPPRCNRSSHVLFQHMSRKRYTCNLCDYKGTPVLHKMRRHVAKAHGKCSGQVCWTDNRSAINDEYKATYVAAYGSYRTPNKLDGMSLSEEQCDDKTNVRPLVLLDNSMSHYSKIIAQM